MTRLPEPTDLRDYLKSRSWEMIEEAQQERLYVLRNDQYPRRQLAFPMDVSAPDYPEAAELVIAKVAELTGQMAEAVLARIRAVRSDVLRLRVKFDGNDTSLPLGFAAALVRNTEAMLRSTASTVVNPRMRHPKLNRTEAAQFVEKARFEQTEEGSFIIQVSCPINSMDAQGTLSLDDRDAPFVRKVTNALDKSLRQLSSAIESDRVPALVDQIRSSTTPIVSANLCEALVAMHDERLNNSLDFSFEWSALRPQVSGPALLPILFQRDYFDSIEEVGRELRAVEPNDIEDFVGTVEGLEGTVGLDGRRSGIVVLSILLPDEEEAIRAKVDLSADDYEKAHRAHMSNRSYVRVRGRLLPGRQPRLISETAEFELIAREVSASLLPNS